MRAFLYRDILVIKDGRHRQAAILIFAEDLADAERQYFGCDAGEHPLFKPSREWQVDPYSKSEMFVFLEAHSP